MDESKLLSHAAINSWESGVRDMGAPGTPSITAQHMQGRVCLGGGERRLGRGGVKIEASAHGPTNLFAVPSLFLHYFLGRTTKVPKRLQHLEAPPREKFRL